MTTFEIIMCSAIIALGLVVILLETKIYSLLSVTKRNSKTLLKVIAKLIEMDSHIRSIEEDYDKLTELTDKVEDMLSELLNALVLAEKRTDDIVKNLYAEKIKQINDAKDKTTMSYNINPSVTKELTDSLNENKKESIKTRIKILCSGGQEFYSKYIGDDLVQLLRELSTYEDTSDFLDANPSVSEMLFHWK